MTVQFSPVLYKYTTVTLEYPHLPVIIATTSNQQNWSKCGIYETRHFNYAIISKTFNVQCIGKTVVVALLDITHMSILAPNGHPANNTTTRHHSNFLKVSYNACHVSLLKVFKGGHAVQQHMGLNF